MLRILKRLTLALTIAFVIAFWWLMLANDFGNAAPYAVHIADLRRLAASRRGALPTAIEAEAPGLHLVSGDLFAAGSGLKRQPVAVLAWRLPVPGGGGIVIDSGVGPHGARALGLRAWDADIQTTIDKAMASSGLILLGDEHIDHIGGLLALARAQREHRAVRPGEPLPPGGDVLTKTAFNAAQLPPAPVAAQRHWPEGPLPAPRILGDEPQAVAPGVVVIPAPGHSPGTQMVYAHLADGREVLFAGDIAPLDLNWRELRLRSHLVSDVLGHENRSDVAGWLLTIRQLVAEDPALLVVPGHDAAWLAAAEHKGAVAPFFASPVPGARAATPPASVVF